MKMNPSDHVKLVQSHASDSRATGTVNGSGIDTKGFKYALVLLNAGTVATGGTLDVHVEESSDDAAADAYADISSASFTQVTPSNDNASYAMEIRLSQSNIERYIRVVGVLATAGGDYSIDVLLFNPDQSSLQTTVYTEV